MKIREVSRRLCLLFTLLLFTCLLAPTAAVAAEANVNLGTARGFGVLAGSAITNTGPTVISGTAGGNTGVSAGSAVSGFPPGLVQDGTIHAADAVAAQAQSDLVTGYNDASARAMTADLTGQDLGGLTLVPGVYDFSTSAQLTGNLTLDAQGDPSSVFIFRMGTTLTTASNSSVSFINGAQPCHVYWVVGSSATLGTTTAFAGHIMAMQSITLNTGATVDGQALARNGAVTMDSNTITNNVCALSGFGIDVTKTSNPASGTVVVPGQAITYTLGYENSRATTITGAAIVDTLSPAVTYVPGTLAINGTPIPDTGNYNPATHVINVALPDIPADSLGNVTFQVTVGPWAVSRAGIANVGAFATSGTVVATTSPVVHFVDSVGIAKTIRNTSGSVIRTGSVLEWTIVVTNYGIVPATNVVVTDSVPANTTYVDGSITGKGADASLVPALRWNVGTIPVGGSVSLTFQSYVNPNTPNRTYISNRAYVVSDQGPQNVSPQVGGRVNDNPIVVVRTSGAEDITLGLMGLLGALALGFAWRGRPTSGSTRKRASRVTAAMLLSMLLVLGTMEVGASFGLPLPTPGDAITQATQSIMPAAATRTAGPAVSSSGVMGRVTIARIGISQKLVEGRTMSALAKGLWRQPTSVKPGDAGACVIAGHRTSRQFANLSKARAGDIVWVTYGRAKLKYRVASVTTLNVTPNTPGFRVGAKEKLVLYTCLPRWRGDKRTVVVCYRAR